MDRVTPATFWGAVTVIAAAMGAVFSMSVSHSGEPKHSEAALETDVTEIQVRLERVQTNTEHNARSLVELKDQVQRQGIEQREQSDEILEAIRNGS